MARDQINNKGHFEPQRSSQAGRFSLWASRLLSVLFWLLVWQVAALAVGQQFILPSPLETLQRLSELLFEADFWSTITHSLLHIACGFLSALVFGTLMAVAAYRLRLVRVLMAPVVATVKSVPVASFIILLLVWVHSTYLSVIVAHLLAFPIMYTNLLQGLEATDTQLLEMADVFQIRPLARVRSIYLLQVLPYFEAAASLALGFCWKAGIAAEVIAIPSRSIGEELYHAKVFLDTSSLFAWTIVIICMSVLVEKGFSYLIKRLVKRIEERP